MPITCSRVITCIRYALCAVDKPRMIDIHVLDILFVSRPVDIVSFYGRGNILLVITADCFMSVK